MSRTSWVLKMWRYPKSVQELQYALQAIQPIMTDPEVSRDKKRETLNMMVNELTEETFSLEPVADQIMEIINMKEQVCQEYDDADAQVKDILAWLPRMTKYRNRLEKKVKQHRKKYGLKL